MERDRMLIDLNSGRRATILLAEDGDAIRSLPRFLLERHGYRVLEAAHGLEALYSARKHAGQIDLLIAELELRFMDGPELAEHVARAHPEVKTIFISSDEGACNRIRSHTFCLKKPVPTSTLVWAIKRMLGPNPEAGIRRLHAALSGPKPHSKAVSGKRTAELTVPALMR